MSKNLAITVLTWNDWKNTVNCLESIFQNKYDNFDVILVNNNSDKEHIDKIYEWSNNNVIVQDDEIIFNSRKNISIVKVDRDLIIDKKGKEIFI